MLIVAVPVLILSVTGSTSLAVRTIRLGMLDAHDLASKLAIPHPRCAAEWPELRLESVVVDPEGSSRVLVGATWPAHPECRAFLLLDLDEAPSRARRLLAQWCDDNVSLSPRTLDGERIRLRRRRSRDAMCARVVRETA
jgi:hypothetical protein